MALAHVLGVPRIGPNRELKFAQEAFWRGEIDEAALKAVASGIRQANWQRQHAAGLDCVTVGDFAFYDQMLNHVALLGCAPARFGFGEARGLSEYFQLARGNADCHAMEMTKWFDTNYHYLVPEFNPDTVFSLGTDWLFDEVAEAQTAGFNAKPVLIGPLSFLWLGKEKTAGFNRLDLLDRLLPVYAQILTRLKAQGVEWVQIDEPILALDLPADWRIAFERAYHALNSAGMKLLHASYFGPLRENLLVALKLPVAGVHIDCVHGGEELAQVIDWLPATKVLSVGVIDGRNIWKTDLAAVIDRFDGLHQRLADRLWLAPSCSLLHVPASLAGETRLDAELKSWLAYADEKLPHWPPLKPPSTRGARPWQPNWLTTRRRWYRVAPRPGCTTPQWGYGSPHCRRCMTCATIRSRFVRRRNVRASTCRLFPPQPSVRFRRLAKFAAPARALKRANSARPTTPPRCSARSAPPFPNRKPWDSTCWCMAKPSATTWSNTSASN